MKTKLLFAFCVLFVCNVAAQSDYSSYLTQSMDELKKGNCEGAQKWYNVYKELSGESKPSVQVMIDDCIQKVNEEKSYSIGDKIKIDNKIYKVAYVEDGGKHGFAVCENGSGSKPDNSVIPTWAEFKLIDKNNKVLKLCGKYWSTRCDSGNWYYTYGLGGRGSGSHNSGSTYDILLIYRF